MRMAHFTGKDPNLVKNKKESVFLFKYTEGKKILMNRNITISYKISKIPNYISNRSVLYIEGSVCT